MKKVVMKSTSAQKVTAVITLKMNDDGTNPITNTNFTSSELEQKEIDLYEDENGTPLQVSTPIKFTGFYSASLGSNLSIESTYDIYDWKGKLIDKDRTAVNNLASVLSNITSITRGKKVELTLTVVPTYLYVLSDTDAEFAIEVK